MALLESNGKLSGKCGDFVFRQVNGRTIVCARPTLYSKCKDPSVLARRSRFKMANKLGSTLGRHPAMKSIWNLFGSNKKLNAFNKMVKEFYPHVSGSNIGNSFRMCPFMSNLSVESQNMNQENSLMTAEGEITFSEFGLENISTVQLITLIFLKDPLDANFPEYDVLSFESHEVEYVLNQKIKIEHDIREGAEIIDMYSERKMFYIFAAYDNDHNIIGYSDTFTFA